MTWRVLPYRHVNQNPTELQYGIYKKSSLAVRGSLELGFILNTDFLFLSDTVKFHKPEYCSNCTTKFR